MATQFTGNINRWLLLLLLILLILSRRKFSYFLCVTREQQNLFVTTFRRCQNSSLKERKMAFFGGKEEISNKQVRMSDHYYLLPRWIPVLSPKEKKEKRSSFMFTFAQHWHNFSSAQTAFFIVFVHLPTFFSNSSFGQNRRLRQSNGDKSVCLWG